MDYLDNKIKQAYFFHSDIDIFKKFFYNLNTILISMHGGIT